MGSVSWLSRLCGLVVVSSFFVAAPAGLARAQPETPPTVVLAFEGEWEPGLRGEVWADLVSMLRERHVRLLTETDAPSSRIATVRIAAPDAASAVRVVIEDHLTAKLVERSLALAHEEPDTWSTLIAAGSDELLRASWVELSMRSAPPPAREPPPEVTQIVEESIAPAPPTTPHLVGLAVRAEMLVGERLLAPGASAGVLFAVDPHVVLGLRAAAAGLVPQQTPRASVDGALFAGDLELGAPLLDPGQTFRLALVGLARLGGASLQAHARAEGLDATGTLALFALAGGGVRLGVHLDAVDLEVGVLVLAPLASARASDGVEDVLAIAGPLALVEIGAQLWP